MVVNSSEFGLLEDRRMPATTLERWRRFVDEDPIAFELLAESKWQKLDPRTSEEYDERRANDRSELIIVETPTVHDVLHQGRLLTLNNRREISTRRGLIVASPWATGKSTRSSLPLASAPTVTRISSR
jgi:hypothetical protein